MYGDEGTKMKKKILLKRLFACVLAASLMASVAACSSDRDTGRDEEEETAVETSEETTTEEETSEESTEETTEETSEETTEETTEETSEETTEAASEETSEETTTEVIDPAVAMYNDPEVREWALRYINDGYEIDYMDHDAGESWWGPGTNMVEGFAAGETGDNIFILDYVMKFPDYETADAFLTELDDSGFGNVVRTENGDGSCTFVIDDGMWTGSLSTNNVIVLVCNEDFELEGIPNDF